MANGVGTPLEALRELFDCFLPQMIELADRDEQSFSECRGVDIPEREFRFTKTPELVTQLFDVESAFLRADERDVASNGDAVVARRKNQLERAARIPKDAHVQS